MSKKNKTTGYTDDHAKAGLDTKFPPIETWRNQFKAYEILVDDPEFMVRMRIPAAFSEVGDPRALPALRRLADRRPRQLRHHLRTQPPGQLPDRRLVRHLLAQRDRTRVGVCADDAADEEVALLVLGLAGIDHDPDQQSAADPTLVALVELVEDLAQLDQRRAPGHVVGTYCGLSGSGAMPDSGQTMGEPTYL